MKYRTVKIQVREGDKVTVKKVRCREEKIHD